MGGQPTGTKVPCPRCSNPAYAIVPEKGEIVEEAADADAKTWVNCHDCGKRFLVHYREPG